MEVGRRALNLMLEEIESGSRPAACAPVPPELVVRQSTASPRGRNRIPDSDRPGGRAGARSSSSPLGDGRASFDGG